MARLIDWLIGRWFDWLIGSIDSIDSIGRLIDWLVFYLSFRRPKRLPRSLRVWAKVICATSRWTRRRMRGVSGRCTSSRERTIAERKATKFYRLLGLSPRNANDAWITPSTSTTATPWSSPGPARAKSRKRRNHQNSPTSTNFSSTRDACMSCCCKNAGGIINPLATKCRWIHGMVKNFGFIIRLLMDWLTDSLMIDLLMDWLTDWLIGLFHRLIGWLIGWWFDHWSIDWLIVWLVDWLIDW